MGNFLDTVTGRRAARVERLMMGLYYSPVESVLLLKNAPIEKPKASDFAIIRRKKEHPFYIIATNVAKAVDSVENTILDLRSIRGRYDPDNETIASSMRSYEGESRTARSRKRKLDCINIDGNKRSLTAEIAHLVPHAPSCANLHADMVLAMTGMPAQAADTDDDEELHYHRSMALVHGVLTQNSSTGKMERIPRSGVKHNRVNMARVFGRRAYLDTWPKLLILPIMTLEEVLEYDGGKYEVLVIGGDDDVYIACRLTGSYPLATFDEISCAVTTLQFFVKAAAFSLVHNSKSDEMIAKLTAREKRMISKSKADIKGEGVRVPQLNLNRRQMSGIKVAKLTFSMDDAEKHQECDPYALFIKAVAVVSSMQGQKILPGCTPIHDCEGCLDMQRMECHCSFDDPDVPIPSEICIETSSVPPESKRRKTQPF